MVAKILSAIYITGMITWSACSVGDSYQAGIYTYVLPLNMGVILIGVWIMGYFSNQD